MMLSIRSTQKTQLIDITQQVQDALHQADATSGLCMIYCPHTTAAITINENADPTVQRDILMVLNDMVPWKADYHHMEGNSPAHVKSTLVGVSQWVGIQEGRLALGTWQGIFFCEFDGPRNRRVHLHIIRELVHG